MPPPPTAPPADPPWARDDRPARAEFRTFLVRQPAATHALVLCSPRMPVPPAAEDVAALAAARGMGLVVLGPPALRDLGSLGFVAEGPAAPAATAAHVASLVQGRGPAAVLLAPSAEQVRAFLELDGLLAARLPPTAARWCLLPRGALQQLDPQASLDLSARHAANLVL